MKVSELREMREEELTDKLSDLRRQLFDLRSQAVTEKQENSMAGQNIKRVIARVKTIQRERELAEKPKK